MQIYYLSKPLKHDPPYRKRNVDIFSRDATLVGPKKLKSFLRALSRSFQEGEIFFVLNVETSWLKLLGGVSEYQ